MLKPFPFLKVPHSVLSDKTMACTYNTTDTGCGITLREARICMINCMEFGATKVWLSMNFFRWKFVSIIKFSEYNHLGVIWEPHAVVPYTQSVYTYLWFSGASNQSGGMLRFGWGQAGHSTAHCPSWVPLVPVGSCVWPDRFSNLRWHHRQMMVRNWR